MMDSICRSSFKNDSDLLDSHIRVQRAQCLRKYMKPTYLQNPCRVSTLYSGVRPSLHGGGTKSLKSSPIDRFLRNFSWQFNLLSEFLPEIC